MHNETTTERLETILADIEQPLADDLRNHYYLVDPLEFAKLLHSLEIPDSVKSALLALKVNQRPQYKGPDLAPLVARAAEQFWEHIVETYKTLDGIVL